MNLLELCKCNLGIGNTGIPQGVKAFAQLLYIIIVPTFDEDGNLNFIDCAVPFTQLFLDGKLNQDDPTKRWYVVKNLKNIDRPKTDPVTKEYDDGSINFIRDGVRSFTALIPGGTAVFLGKLLQGKCNSHSFYEVDICLNVGGNGRDKTKLYPYLMGQDTINHFLMLAKGDTNQEISVNFQYDIQEKDELRRFITDRSITADLTPINVNSLVDVNIVPTNPSTTTVDVLATYDYGDHCDPDPYVVGSLPTDWLVKNLDTPATIPVISVDDTDADNGNYELTYAIQPSNDMTVEIIPSANNGFEGAPAPYTIP